MSMQEITEKSVQGGDAASLRRYINRMNIIFKQTFCFCLREWMFFLIFEAEKEDVHDLFLPVQQKL
jgi:hypothetical protein